MSTLGLFSPWRMLLIVFASLSLTACFTTTPLITPMELPLGDQVRTADVEAAMQKSALKLGWALSKGEAGQTTGTLKLRGHTVVVQFVVTKTALQAHYKESEGMKYDGKNIHKKYHMWIDQFFKNVRQNLIGKAAA